MLASAAVQSAPFGKRAFHTAVWTGQEMIIWGGNVSGSGYLNDGARFYPPGNRWTAMDMSGVPAERAIHTAVWTGNEMIVWGGLNATGTLNNGGRYNPLANSWTTTRTNSAPTTRYYHSAVWTGGSMIIWGGYGTTYLNTGGFYYPLADSWTTIATNGAPSGRALHTAVWTGGEMIVWGGGVGSGYVNDGARYDLLANAWTATAANNAPIARSQHTAVWSGTEMIVWGGYNGSNLNVGGKYNPTANAWTTVRTNNAPTARRSHTAVWTGSEMIVWGGVGPGGYVNDGGRYNPAANTWTTVNTNGAPSPRAYHTAVWTGTEMIVWGGYVGSPYLNDGGRYNPTTDTWTPLPPASACQPGFPDDFECHTTLAGDSISTVANNVGATKEPGEPEHGDNAGGSSLWWSWAAPSSGGVTLTTAGSDFDTMLGVYTGTNVSTLTTVASDGRTNLAGSVTFKATAGVDYKIAVDGRDGASGNILLNLKLRAQPANDNFASRQKIGSGGLVTGQNLGATRESGETDHAGLVGGKSVWWTWTATASGCVTITTEGSDFDTLLAVYTNTSLAALSPVAVNDDATGDVASAVTFKTVAGQAYQIAVDGFNRTGGNIVLRVIPFNEAPNDDFANAAVLTGTNITVTTSNICASVEAGEPDIWSSPGARSLWWRWQAPASGGVVLDLAGSDFSTYAAVYTGSTLGTLTQVAIGSGRLVFKAVGGTTYRMVVDVGGNFGDPAATLLKFKLALLPSPPNDDFANRLLLGTSAASTNASNFGATIETNEPNHALGIGFGTQLSDQTVWWTWNSPLHLPGKVVVVSTNFLTTVNVYTGTSMTNLTRVAGRTGTGPTNEVAFNAIPFTSYVIAVDGNDGGAGFYTLSAGYASSPPNDNFANRITLTGTNIFTSGYNVSASRETGEPNHSGDTGVGSVWWSWSAPSAGRLFLTTIGSSFPPLMGSPLLGAYQGPSVSGLSSVASVFYPGLSCPFFSFANFDVTGPFFPQTYQIAVDGESGSPQPVGGIDLGLIFIPKPVNDDFNSRTLLTGSFLVATGSLVAASQQAGEVVEGFSSGLRTAWYSWTAPDDIGGSSGRVTLRVTGIDFPGSTGLLVQVYQGSSLAALTPVPVESETKGNIRQITFRAQTGATYQIVVAGESDVAGGLNASFIRRRANTPINPLAESGSFVLRLNYSTLALRIRNVMPASVPIPLSPGFGKKVAFGAAAEVVNEGPSPSGPVRVRVLAVTGKGQVYGDEGSFTPIPGGGVVAGGTNSFGITGGSAFGASAVAVLEEQMSGIWVARDSSLVLVGFANVSLLCASVTGGGVILLEPGLGLGGQCFCPARLTGVQINGPASVNEGSSAAYWGTAFFDNGTSPSFTNTIWTTSDTNRFPITTNGILTTGNITAHTPVFVTSYFTYVGVTQSTNKLVTVQNLPPPMLTNLITLPDRNLQLSLQGVPGRQHVIEASTNLAPPIQWLSLITNATIPGSLPQSGSLIYADRAATNFNQRFYRAREY